jgi:hypothetical protein
MDDKAEEYRRLADEADRAATEATDVAAKRAYWQIADSYRQLAKLFEKTNK